MNMQHITFLALHRLKVLVSEFDIDRNAGTRDNQKLSKSEGNTKHERR